MDPGTASHTPLPSLVLATGNSGKAAEFMALLDGRARVLTLRELGLPTALAEDGDTLEANALQKARAVHARTGMCSLADDTGLEVYALDGAPGVYSARYAGDACDAGANMHKLLHVLRGAADRRARFRTVLALVDGAQERLFEGVVEGRIEEAPRGSMGFGYDPLFIPDGGVRTFAEMPPEEKNALSHRARAVAALRNWLSGTGR